MTPPLLFFLNWPYTLTTAVFGAMAAMLLRIEHPRGLLDGLLHGRPVIHGGSR